MPKETFVAQLALKKAIWECGGAAELGRALGITTQAVCGWKVCPPRKALAVAAIVKEKRGTTTASDLCPDIYPAEFAA